MAIVEDELPSHDWRLSLSLCLSSGDSLRKRTLSTCMHAISSTHAMHAVGVRGSPASRISTDQSVRCAMQMQFKRLFSDSPFSGRQEGCPRSERETKLCRGVEERRHRSIICSNPLLSAKRLRRILADEVQPLRRIISRPHAVDCRCSNPYLSQPATVGKEDSANPPRRAETNRSFTSSVHLVTVLAANHAANERGGIPWGPGERCTVRRR
mmetsp:Transcript_138440/g.441651  ORF Transcript_138440/g.441651 Transcript_138440/m.441651 type:complete len:211 (-) Transcript_138440:506-1138(-)